ncbi:MAG: Gfo/Idh/MocA family oxidoreductase [Planctomycetota bacterium]|nr:Gfo/Idh/MocA family oxidoreductase [Planctomycetota bacterium]
MELTKEQIEIGKDNFTEAATSDVLVHDTSGGVKIPRREFLKGAAAGGVGLGAYYFGYQALSGEKVRTAFVGVGDEGNVLITEHPDDYMDIVAIADIRKKNIERTIKGSHPVARIGLEKKLGAAKTKTIQRYDSFQALLAAKDELKLEAVVIAVPLSHHAPLAIMALQAGLHVLCEKLMAHNVTECKQMIKAARDANKLLTVGHQRHYSVLYDNANFLVKQGLLGDIRHIHAQWHRNNSFKGSDSWRKFVKLRPDEKKQLEELEAAGLTELYEFAGKKYGYETAQQLVDWRLYNATGGGIMAELGSHQMDAASIFLGKVHPLAVQGYGGRNFYGVKNIGTSDKQADDRDIDDHVYVTLEFPGKYYDASDNPHDKCIVTYSSLNTNRHGGYGERIMGSRGTMIVKTEKEVVLHKEATAGSAGGPDQRLWVVNSGSAGPALDSYETTGPSAAAKSLTAGAGLGDNISRGYREEMEHFCHCIRTQGPNFWPNGQPLPPNDGGPRCNGVIAMADAIMALTSNLAMKHQKRIVFKDEWFDFENDAAPETDSEIVGS